MNKYTKYVVVGIKKDIQHAYSTAMGSVEALNLAINCADHPSMRGSVYGEDSEGNRTLVYTSQERDRNPEE